MQCSILPSGRVPLTVGIEQRIIITHAHRAPLTQRGPRPRLVATSHRLAICVIVSGFRAALDLDTFPLRNLIIRPRCTERAKPEPVLIMHIGFFACCHAISLERSRFSKIATLFFLALVALKLLVSLISRLVACSARIVVDTHIHTHTDTENDYCNPRCACASRYKDYFQYIARAPLLPRPID